MWNVLVLLVVLCSWVGSAKASVSYDSKAIVINGQRRILISGSIHYPRSSPEVILYKCASRVSSSFCLFTFLLSLNYFLQLGTSIFTSLSSFFFFLVVKFINFSFGFIVLLSLSAGIFWLVADVARSYSESQGRRFGCDSDLCFLEWA